MENCGELLIISFAFLMEVYAPLGIILDRYKLVTQRYENQIELLPLLNRALRRLIWGVVLAIIK